MDGDSIPGMLREPFERLLQYFHGEHGSQFTCLLVCGIEEGVVVEMRTARLLATTIPHVEDLCVETGPLEVTLQLA